MSSLPPPRPLPLRDLLAQHDIRPRKSLGQNFLHDVALLERIVAAAALTPDDTVLEIGPGAGSLTQHLAYNAARVVAVELDERLRPLLAQTLQDYPNVSLVFGDILAQNVAQLIGPDVGSYKVVANVPYYITAAIFRHLLDAEQRPSCLVLTVQREVAQRIVAPAGQLSLLGLSVQYYGTAKVVAKIPAGAFMPRPKVDSAVVRVEVYPQPLAPDVPTEYFFKVAQAGFGQKRKQLKNALRNGLACDAETVNGALARADIDGSRRAQTLTLAEWGALARCLME